MESSTKIPTIKEKTKQFFKFDPITTIAALFIVYILSQILAVFIVGLYPNINNWTEQRSEYWLNNSAVAQFLFVFIAEIIAIYMVINLVKLAKITNNKVGLVKPALRDFGWAILFYGIYFVTIIVVMGLARSIPGLNFEQEQQIGFENAKTQIELLLTFSSLVLLVPFAEELMFRGFLFSSLRAKYKFVPSLIATSIIFGVAHPQFGADAPLLWVAAIDTFILSAFLCTLRERSGSIWPGVFLHGIKNGIAFFLLFGSKIFT